MKKSISILFVFIVAFYSCQSNLDQNYLFKNKPFWGLNGDIKVVEIKQYQLEFLMQDLPQPQKTISHI